MPLGVLCRSANANLRKPLLFGSVAANRSVDLGFSNPGQIAGRGFQVPEELALPARPLAASREILVDACPRQLLFEFFGEIAERDANLDSFLPARRPRTQPDVSELRCFFIHQ